MHKVRAHHGMCLAFFIGEGYSSSFVDNMWENKLFLERANPIVEIVDCADSICEACPFNEDGMCQSIDKVEQYDRKVLEHCAISNGSILSWKEYFNLVNEKVIKSGIRKEICSDCEWNAICSKIGHETTRSESFGVY